MSKNSYVKYNARKGKLSKAYYEAVSDGLNKFIEYNRWYENLPEKENRNYGVHLECSYLCHGIWTKIMKNESNNGNPYSHNYFYWKNSSYENEILFHFDIMNNPNKKSCGLANCCNDDKLKGWKNIYHSIGNMTPIPWFKVEGEHYIDGQALHNALDERWDLFLNVLKKSWSNWCSEESFTFESYMSLTCQQIYYTDIYNDFKNNIKEIENIDDLKILKDWGQKINSESQLLLFPKYKEYQEESIADLITNLIKIRCCLIGLLLKEN